MPQGERLPPHLGLDSPAVGVRFAAAQPTFCLKSHFWSNRSYDDYDALEQAAMGDAYN